MPYCPNCQNEVAKQIISESGETACSQCGILLDSALFADDSAREVAQGQGSFVTNVQNRVQMRLPKLNATMRGNDSFTQRERRHLKKKKMEMDTAKFVCMRLKISRILPRIEATIQAVAEKQNFRAGVETTGMVGACVYYIAKQEAITVRIKEIATILDIDPKRITRALRTIQSVLGTIYMPVPDLTNWVQRTLQQLLDHAHFQPAAHSISTRLGVPPLQEVCSLALKLYKYAIDSGYACGRDPYCLAMACLLLGWEAYGHRKVSRPILFWAAQTLGLGAETVLLRYREIRGLIIRATRGEMELSGQMKMESDIASLLEQSGIFSAGEEDKELLLNESNAADDGENLGFEKYYQRDDGKAQLHRISEEPPSFVRSRNQAASRSRKLELAKKLAHSNQVYQLALHDDDATSDALDDETFVLMELVLRGVPEQELQARNLPSLLDRLAEFRVKEGGGPRPDYKTEGETVPLSNFEVQLYLRSHEEVEEFRMVSHGDAAHPRKPRQTNIAASEGIDEDGAATPISHTSAKLLRRAEDLDYF
ncbi:uncharacterized protein VTP21DRAFT_2771 [Calcarisporiella thermophila]|uniref:uncharacterized protein n=1 Tax=Calcarisporiella thermophila TaxID=911321 RepID=UPI0037439151